MQSDQAPCSAARRVEFPSSVTNCLRDDREEISPLLGSIFSDSNLAWLSKGPLLEVVDTSDGAKIAAWTFGAVVRDFKTKVTCVAELPHATPSLYRGPVEQLAVGLECELTGGMLCVFNLAGSRVLRAINFPSKITAIDIVSLGAETLSPLHASLHDMNGIAAVGTNDGQILLIDLRRNDCNRGLRLEHCTDWEGIRDELQPCELISLEDANLNVSDDYLNKHPSLHLNEKYFLRHQRLVVHAQSRDFMPEDPSVTSILYVPQLASLCVGFAFGSFQIWSLQTLNHVYSLPFYELNPVVRISFQEACDDPNASCYLWTVKGGLSAGDASGDLNHPVPVFGPPSATMYSLCYDEKVFFPDYGYFYKKFMMCSTVFEYDLSGDKDTVGGRLVSLYSLNRGLPGSTTAALQSEDSCAVGPSSNAISLSLIVWETWGPTGPTSSVNPVNTHMAVFDVNQWYFDQMPARLSQRGGTSRSKSVANYLVSYDLGNAISSSGGLLLNVRVNSSSLLQFTSVQNVEEFSRPSSLSFDSVVLMERQVVHLKHPGVQRAFLANLLSSGPGALMTPTNLFHECLVLGLRPILMDASDAVNVALEEQRSYVLCVALEQHLGRFVSRCAREWADGRLAAAGCTLAWLLSVAWNRAAVLKQLAIRLCAQLFDHSGENLDYNAQRQVHHIVSIFRLVETLFETVVQNRWHLALNEWPQVILQNDALKLECQYYDVLQWLVDVELLPEGLNPKIPYPVQEIALFYHARRLELHQLFEQQSNFEEMTDFLLIDGLLKHQTGGSKVFLEWERDAGGNAGPGGGQYPPTSLQALLRTFLVKDVALEVKHSVVVYVLMDLANILDNEQYQSALHNFLQFPAAFQMSVGSVRLIQAFWHLDHKTFNTALDLLLDPLVSVQDIELWQHRCIIRLFMLQGKANLALRYVRARRPPLQEQSDFKLHLNLLIANDLINEAFVYQRNHRTEENAKLLLSQFFQGCEERNHLRTILQFSLDDQEEVTFARYLENSKHPAADDLRVLYFLKRSRYIEAHDVNQDLRRKGRSGGTRDVVVNAFFKTLPPVTRKLAAHCTQQQHKLKSWNQVEKPTPLFVNPKIASPRMQYKSSLMEAALEKSRETWAKITDSIPHIISEVESTPFLCTPRTKQFNFSRSDATTPDRNSERRIADRKRPREDDDGQNQQFKRSRFQKLETALAELNQQQQQREQASLQARLSTYSCTDTLTLLNTPIVQRRSPSTRAKLQQQLIACSPGHTAATPQSIIKVRKRSGSAKSLSPVRLHNIMKEPIGEPELTEEESESEVFPKSSQPSKGESETDSDPEDKAEEEGPVVVGARRTIDFDSGLSSSDTSRNLSFSDSQLLSPSTSPLRLSLSNVSSKSSLSRIVLLSEAGKVGKQRHSVTFGKGSVCLYDQDEPVDSEVAVQDESSNEAGDLEPNKEGDLNVDDVGGKQLVDEFGVVETSQHEQKTMETNTRFRLETSGIGSMTSSNIQDDLSQTDDSEVFHSADSSGQGIFASPTFRKNLARPPVKEIARLLCVANEDKDGINDDSEHAKQSNPVQFEEKYQSISNFKCLSYSTELTVEENKEELETLQPCSSDLSLASTAKLSSSVSLSGSSENVAGPSRSRSGVGKQERMEAEKEKQVEIVSSAVHGTIHELEKNDTNDDSVSLIELDDDSDSDSESEHDVDELSREASDNVQDSENSVGGKEFLPEDSNIFRTSYFDDAGLSTDHDSRSSLNNHESEIDPTGEASVSQDIIEEAETNSKHGSEIEPIGEASESQEVDEEAESHSKHESENEYTAAAPESQKINEEVETKQVYNLDTKESILHYSNYDISTLQGDTHSSEINAEFSKHHVHSEDPDHHLESVIEYSKESATFTPLVSHSSLNIVMENISAKDLNPQILRVDPEFGGETSEISTDAVESNDNFNQALVINSVDISAENSKPTGGDDAGEFDSNVNAEDSFEFTLHQVVKVPNKACQILSEEETGDSQARQSDMTFVEPSTSVARNESEQVIELLPFKIEANQEQGNSSCAASEERKREIVQDHDDMPSLRLDAAGQDDEDLCETDTNLENISEDSTIHNNMKLTEKGNQNAQELASLSKQDLCPSSPQGASVTSSSVPAESNQPFTPKKERKRKGSISSTKSETFVDDGSTRRVTRAMKHNLDPVSGSDSSSTVNVRETESLRQTRHRSYSTSSAGSVCTEPKDSRRSKNKRPNSVSSYDLQAENVTLPKDKLDKISEGDSTSEKSNEKVLQSGKKKKRSSESEADQLNAVASNTIDEYETSRRLTRHQRAFLAKSREISSVAHASFTGSIGPPEIGQEEDVSDDDKVSVSSVRSSRRLQIKREKQGIPGSPSSTASTVINPALTPVSQKRRRRQSSSDVSEVNRDVSPVSSVRRQRTPKSVRTPSYESSLPGTPTRRSARLNALQSAQSEDGDNQSVASMSPSSVTSGRKRMQRRRLSASSETPSEQFAFSSPHVQHGNLNENPDGDTSLTDAFAFSPPETVTTPSKAKNPISEASESGGASKRSARLARQYSLQTIKEESSTSKISQDDTITNSPVLRSNRPSWFFMDSPTGDRQDDAIEKQENVASQQPAGSTEGRRGWHSAYHHRSKFPIVPVPKTSDSETEGSDGDKDVRPRRKTRKTT